MNLLRQETRPTPVSYPKSKTSRFTKTPRVLPLGLDPIQGAKFIPLTQGQYAIVDEGDYEALNAREWTAEWDVLSRSFYAVRREHIGRTRKNIYMHRQIMGFPEGLFVDHREPAKTLDNRRENLRIATPAQSVLNREIGKNNTTGFKGVKKRGRRWVAEIQFRHRKHHLGTFDSAKEAYEAYKQKAIELHGEFARLA